MLMQVTGAKTVSVRNAPWRHHFDTDTVLGELRNGDTIDVDDSIRYFDWEDRSYYKVKSDKYKDGFINTEAVRPMTKNRRVTDGRKDLNGHKETSGDS